MKNYQLKLDFGEGQECHQAYEEYLQEMGREDSPETWAIFVKCWELMAVFKAMDESKGETLQ